MKAQAKSIRLLAGDRGKFWLAVIGLLLSPATTWAQQTAPEYDAVYVRDNAAASSAAKDGQTPLESVAEAGAQFCSVMLSPVDFSAYRNGIKPQGRFFFGHDQMFLSTSPVMVGSATQSAAAASAGQPNSPSQHSATVPATSTSSLLPAHGIAASDIVSTSGMLGSALGSGNRWEFGYRPTETTGWSVSILENVNSSQTTLAAPQPTAVSHGTH